MALGTGRCARGRRKQTLQEMMGVEEVLEITTAYQYVVRCGNFEEKKKRVQHHEVGKILEDSKKQPEGVECAVPVPKLSSSGSMESGAAR